MSNLFLQSRNNQNICLMIVIDVLNDTFARYIKRKTVCSFLDISALDNYCQKALQNSIRGQFMT